ncbi:hypothetical protein ACFQLX_00225 [Streptomyces polyrhachis]|uniref:Antibiotic biosynthesis monooxygenase n=1 Tax=Streptomyces polyrhachis TaxID=1282885 RepID=A0ABW2GAM4_9ACTN
MEFIQVIDYETDRPEEMWALSEQYRKEREGEPGGPNRVTIVQDRENPRRFLSIVEFPSYEEAMRNNDRPEVQEFSAGMGALCTRPPVFVNGDLQQRIEFG